MSDVDFFSAQVDRIVELRRVHGRFPTPKDDVNTQAATLDARLPGWREGNPHTVRVWQDSADAVVAFYLEHGRTPFQTAKDPGEKTLGIWIRDVRVYARYARGGVLTNPEQFAWLDERIPGWRGKTKADAWSDTLREIRAHVREYGSLPEKGRLGAVLDRARRRADDPSFAAKAADLDRIDPLWQVYPVFATFSRYAHDVARFVAENGHTPRYSNVVPPEELELAVWLSKQRSRQRSGRLDADRSGLITKLLGENWAAHTNDVSPWEEKADALADFVREHGRFPKQPGPTAEAKLAVFYRHQIAAARGRGNTTFNDHRRQYLDRVAPGWDAKL